MAVSQRQIAEKLKIDPSMVSHALRGDSRVAEATRLRVIETAEELGYHAGSNHEARSLIARRYGKRVPTGIIAVVMPSTFFAGTALPRVPYFASYIEGIEQAASERELDIYLCSFHENRLPRLIEREGVDGIIWLGGEQSNPLPVNLPAVSIGGAGEFSSGLVAANREGARLATKHLIELGHRRIACLAFSSTFWPGHRYPAAADRMDGYSDGLTEAGIEHDRALLAGHVSAPTVEAGAAAMTEMLNDKLDFTAIVCFNDLIAMGAIEVLRHSGRRVPEDVSVVGFDDVSEHYSFEPKLTSIYFDRFAMGQRAVAAMYETREKQERGETIEPRDEVFPVELVVRGSTQKIST